MNNPHQQIKLVIVSQKTPSSQPQQSDPLQEQLMNLKLTSNLLKQMSFNNTINKFDYFQKLLQQQNNRFNAKISKCVNNQKQLVKKIKTLQKGTRDIRNQSTILNYSKVHVQLEELRTTKEETLKYQKLSQGMLKYLEKINQRLDKM